VDHPSAPVKAPDTVKSTKGPSGNSPDGKFQWPKFKPFLPFDIPGSNEEPSGPGYVNYDDGSSLDGDELGTENNQFSEFSSAKVQRLKI